VDRDRRQPAVVLVVHDEPRAGEILARLVEREGWRAERAATVDEAMERAPTWLPRAVLVDLPKAGLGSALALLARLRSHDDERVASAAVVVVDDAGTGQTALATGADAHLSRPAHVRDIAAALHRAISTK
jgi:ActR/RegA family two-component response regulator